MPWISSPGHAPAGETYRPPSAAAVARALLSGDALAQRPPASPRAGRRATDHRRAGGLRPAHGACHVGRGPLPNRAARRAPGARGARRARPPRPRWSRTRGRARWAQRPRPLLENRQECTGLAPGDGLERIVERLRDVGAVAPRRDRQPLSVEERAHRGRTLPREGGRRELAGHELADVLGALAARGAAAWRRRPEPPPFEHGQRLGGHPQRARRQILAGEVGSEPLLCLRWQMLRDRLESRPADALRAVDEERWQGRERTRCADEPEAPAPPCARRSKSPWTVSPRTTRRTQAVRSSSGFTFSSQSISPYKMFGNSRSVCSWLDESCFSRSTCQAITSARDAVAKTGFEDR